MECGGGELATPSWRTAIASTSWRWWTELTNCITDWRTREIRFDL
jgi:hypothetical protein